ncbi:MAG: CHAT domain-containing protein, partial [Planctomycetota bacterium]
VGAIAATFVAAGSRPERVGTLLGADATEPAVFARAATARYLHFACHGLAEEFDGQSLSLLVLHQGTESSPGADGLLKLDDLLRGWPLRLRGNRLVVLSACRTQVGATHRDEAPYALPFGFLVAGARAVVSSLWAVDDASTAELMADFYRRLLAGDGGEQLAAFTAARKALRATHPDPFHWAAFVYVGVPQ